MQPNKMKSNSGHFITFLVAPTSDFQGPASIKNQVCDEDVILNYEYAIIGTLCYYAFAALTIS